MEAPNQQEVGHKVSWTFGIIFRKGKVLHFISLSSYRRLCCVEDDFEVVGSLIPMIFYPITQPCSGHTSDREERRMKDYTISCHTFLHHIPILELLSSRTKYAAYLVFDRRDSYGFEDVEVKSSLRIVGGETIENILFLDKDTSEEDAEDELGYGLVSIENVRSWTNDTLTQLYSSQTPNLLSFEDVRTWMNNNIFQLHSSHEPQEHGVSTKSDGPYPKMRKDAWLEIELGEFFNEGGENKELDIAIKHFDGRWKHGLIIEGIKIRPKND
ncbi:hypothetical protein PVL29_004817 [Vitis rotundifolia]|uniref:Uncharacterized protein n=1 Tax=Vitis rotundifolia TaxID=103349 RepID=A0AA39A8Y3_VITRO|nr:hypothetical protein PVL29_004817 [Vitis rotundifolia]